jgi:hypothetical protein
MATSVEPHPFVSNFRVHVVSIALGLWLFISGFLWPHGRAQQLNTWIVGLLIALVAFAAMSEPRARAVSAALAIWLFISAFALPAAHVATTWNNAIVAVAVFVMAMIPSGAVHRESGSVGGGAPSRST